jgi:hypothetical protein
LKKPVCPEGGEYRFAKTFPKTGGLACECEHKEHLPAQGSYQEW